MNEYDIEQAIAAIEEELIASMMRNMERHKRWETDEGFQWTMWQAEQLKSLEQYKKQNRKKFQRKFNEINRSIRQLIEEARKQGSMDQELEILDAIQNGWKPPRKLSSNTTTAAEFFKLNTRKLEALITATENDFKKAETAMLRMANDQYRQIIFNAQVYANTGAGTYEKAVDMATRDFRARGLNCIEYKNGARHTMKDYAKMAIRTASKRAYLTGEGEKRQEWGISTVIMNKRGNPCPLCLPFVGKIMIDDVWSGGTSKDGPYPLMSSAIAAGLYHPNCKDSHSTYFPGITTADDKFSKSELVVIEKDYRIDQRKRHKDRLSEKYDRMSRFALAPENKKKYEDKATQVNTEIKTVDVLNEFEMFKERIVTKRQVDQSRHVQKVQMSTMFIDLVEDKNIDSALLYDRDNDRILYNQNAPNIDMYDFDYSFAHELSHRMDELEYHSWENEAFKNAIANTSDAVYNNREIIESWIKPGGKYYDYDAMHALIASLSDGTLRTVFGHGPDYFEKNPILKPAEILADLGALDVLGILPKDSIFEDLIQAYMGVVK